MAFVNQTSLRRKLILVIMLAAGLVGVLSLGTFLSIEALGSRCWRA